MTKVETVPIQKGEEVNHQDRACGEGGASGMLVIFLDLSSGYLSVHIIIIL